MNIKNLFLTKFDNFLLEENNFFKNYKKIYLINFLQLLKKNYPQFNIDEETKNLISDFYDSLFLNPSFKNGNFSHLIEMKDFLSINNIDINILNKTYLLILNNYIKHIFPSSNLEKIKTLTLLLDFYDKFMKTHIYEIEKRNISYKLPEVLEKIYSKKLNLILFGVYKGIPISNKTKIIKIHKNKNLIEVKANHYQIIASKFQKDIYLLDSNTNKTFKAYVKDIIAYKSILLLSDIKEIKRESLKRNYIRVQPKSTLYATISINQKVHTGKIYDLSIKGISIISEKELNLNINETVLIKFKLPTNDKFLFNFTAELRSISYFDNFYRYHFYFEPTPSEEEKLEKYITKREKEIISELTKYLNEEFIDF